MINSLILFLLNWKIKKIQKEIVRHKIGEVPTCLLNMLIECSKAQLHTEYLASAELAKRIGYKRFLELYWERCRKRAQKRAQGPNKGKESCKMSGYKTGGI
jgi:hypothetical protein